MSVSLCRQTTQSPALKGTFVSFIFLRFRKTNVTALTAKRVNDTQELNVNNRAGNRKDQSARDKNQAAQCGTEEPVTTRHE